MFQTKYVGSRQNKYSKVLTWEFSLLWFVPLCAYCGRLLGLQVFIFFRHLRQRLGPDVQLLIPYISG